MAVSSSSRPSLTTSDSNISPNACWTNTFSPAVSRSANDNVTLMECSPTAYVRLDRKERRVRRRGGPTIRTTTHIHAEACREPTPSLPFMRPRSTNKPSVTEGMSDTTEEEEDEPGESNHAIPDRHREVTGPPAARRPNRKQPIVQ